MGLFQVVCAGLLAAFTRAQDLQNCTVDSIPVLIGSTEDAAALATSIRGCSNGDFAVEWVGEVFVGETLHVTGGTSLNITGAGPGAIADGGGETQLFYVDEGSRLHLSDMTLSNGYATDFGGAIFANQSSVVSFSGNMSFVSNSSGDDGGAIFVAWGSTVSWVGDGTLFRNNSAGHRGGAIVAGWGSTVSWVGDGALFSNNSGGSGGGGAISAKSNSTVSWDGDGTAFSDNSAGNHGGAIEISFSTMSIDGDRTAFSDNSAGSHGGAIFFWSSTVSWDGDGTEFISNSASGIGGGAIFVSDATVYWDGDGTEFISNSAVERGGAISALRSTVSWDGDDTQFVSNSAGGDGGAIYASGGSSGGSSVELDEDTTFSNNSAGGSGGALVLINIASEDDTQIEPFFIGTVFIDNRADIDGGAIYLFNCPIEYSFTELTFQSNSAGGAGGAVAAFNAGNIFDPAGFYGCTFSDNKANGTGGAVETSFGSQEFDSCEFERNSAGIGGALRLGGTAVVRDCSFLSNTATNRGPAIAVVTSPNITGSSFDGNDLYCEAGSYQDTEEGARFETVCFDCPDWDECFGCTIEEGDLKPVCAAPLDHTTANESGVTLETLEIAPRYWRATDNSTDILPCYNPDACRGGVTGSEGFCASGCNGSCERLREEGTDCAVCEPGFSPSLGHTCTWCSDSRCRGMVAGAVVAALFAVFVVATLCKFLLSAEVEEGSIGWFRRRVLRAVPVQALKIIVVVWQILTQFADAANATYPGVYQAFLSAVDPINFDLGSVLAAGCLWSGVDFHDRLLVSTLGPLVVVGFLAMTYLVAVRRIGASSETAVEKVRHKHLTALLLLTFLVYSSVSSMVFQTFACETLDDGIEYLRADYRIHCTDAKHKAFEVYAGFVVFVYPVGIPLLYAVLLFQRRDVLADAGADRTVAQPIAGLWEAYRPERFYYEVIECGRRVLLTGVVVFILPNTAAQIAITMLIAFFFFAVFDVLSPYTSESDTWLSRGGHVIVFLSMFDLLLLKVDVSSERGQSQAAFAGVLVAGHVLMVLAIVVEVVGVCCASRPLRESVSERTGPTPSVSGAVVSTGGP